MTPDNQAAGIVVSRPKTDEERRGLAGLCTTSLRMEMPTVVDGVDNRMAMTYGAYPDRIYVLDEQGVIRFKSQPGPLGFKPGEASEALDRLLSGSLARRDGLEGVPWLFGVLGIPAL